MVEQSKYSLNSIFFCLINAFHLCYSSECVVYYIDESTGGLEVSHNCVLSSKDYPGCPGTVSQVKWTPDGCAMAASWTQGGIAVWSTFGALLMCSLGWDYGLHVDLERYNPLHVISMVGQLNQI